MKPRMNNIQQRAENRQPRADHKQPCKDHRWPRAGRRLSSDNHRKLHEQTTNSHARTASSYPTNTYSTAWATSSRAKIKIECTSTTHSIERRRPSRAAPHKRRCEVNKLTREIHRMSNMGTQELLPLFSGKSRWIINGYYDLGTVCKQVDIIRLMNSICLK